MKKNRLLSVVLLCSMSFIAYSQQSNKGLGIEVGGMRIDGDVDSRIIDGYTIGASYYQDISKYLNLELNYNYGKSTGVDLDPGILNQYTDETYWFATNKTEMHNLSISACVRLNIKEKVEFQFAYGPGLLSSQTYMNVLDENNESYSDARDQLGLPDHSNVDYKDRRKQILNYLDNTYETEAIIKVGAFYLGDTPIYISHNMTARFLWYTKYNITLALKASAVVVNSDYLDGIKFRNETDATNTIDIINRIVIGVYYPL